MNGGRVKLSAEDRSRFSREIKTASPVELLTVIRFLEAHGATVAAEDLRFMNSHIGRQAERLLRNVALYRSWDSPGN
jgi:hypothetical protein